MTPRTLEHVRLFEEFYVRHIPERLKESFSVVLHGLLDLAERDGQLKELEHMRGGLRKQLQQLGQLGQLEPQPQAAQREPEGTA